MIASEREITNNKTLQGASIRETFHVFLIAPGRKMMEKCKLKPASNIAS